MPNLQKTDKHSMQENPENDLSTALGALAKALSDHSVEDSKAKVEMHGQSIELEKVRIQESFKLHTKAFYLLAFVIAFILVLSAYLIRTGQVQTGILVISHAASLASGIFIGRNRKGDNSKTD